jgi:hypothetical protein
MRYGHKIVKVYHCLYFVSGPQSIGARTNDEPLEAGVFVSDGIYTSTDCKNIISSYTNLKWSCFVIGFIKKIVISVYDSFFRKMMISIVYCLLLL